MNFLILVSMVYLDLSSSLEEQCNKELSQDEGRAEFPKNPNDSSFKGAQV
jgi:hypothetical protein